MMKDLLLEGAGYSFIPLSIIRNEIVAGTLRRIMLPIHIPPLRLYLAWNNFSMQHARHRFVRDAILNSVTASQVAALLAS
jgi:DNA-binding transcriptional LysR family regulator